MKIYFFILSIFIFTTALAQNNRSANSANKFLDKILATSNQYGFSSPDTSVYYASKALAVSLRNKSYLYVAKSLVAIARIDILKGSVKDGLERLNWAMAIFKSEGDLKNLARCYGLKSTAMGKIGNTTEEIELGYKAYYIYHSINDRSGMITTLTNIANTYESINQFEKAIQALNLSSTYIKIENDGIHSFFIYLNYANIYSKTKKFELAKVNFDSCISISTRYNMIDSKITAYTDMAEMYREMSNTAQSIEFYNKALVLSKQYQLPVEELEALQGILISYQKANRYKEALQVQLKINHISDSLLNAEKIFTIQSIETKNKLGEKEKIIIGQELQIIEQALYREKSRNRFLYLLIGLIILLGFTITVIISYYRSKRAKNIILKQKVKIEFQNQVVEKKNIELENLNTINQKIFTIIAHDFKEPLISMRLLIEALKRESEHNHSLKFYTSDIRNQLIQSELILQNLLDWAKQELQQDQKNLSGVICISDVIDEIKLQLKKQSEDKKVTIYNKVNKDVIINSHIDIVRIVYRNLMANAIKYSHENSTVECGYHPHLNELYIKDHGMGISEENQKKLLHKIVKPTLGTSFEKGYGLGLYITHEMIQKVNGFIRIESEEKKGTCIYFTLPSLTQTTQI
jgi:two-component system sensor histidine kinase/response regulator